MSAREKKGRGLKVMGVSFFVAVFGGFLAFLGALQFGRFFAVAGVIGGFVGMAIHFGEMLRAFKGSRK